MEKDKNDIKVSVLVITYNHELFLRECLDSIVCQKTNFPFEVIVHDDKSSDGTTKIIEEYKQKYPNLIVPIYEKENQYLLGKSILEDCVLPYARGKYIALCEGDDRWCDENKLQKQYNFMETHSKYVACFHNTIYHDLSGKVPNFEFNNIKKNTIVNAKLAFKYVVHTTSFFIKKSNFKKFEFGRGFIMGDYVLFTSVFASGPMMILPDVMSIYNTHNPQGVMCQEVNTSKRRSILGQQIKYLEKYNEYTKYKYNREIQDHIVKLKTYIEFRELDDKLVKTKTKSEFYSFQKNIRESEQYKYVMSQGFSLYKIKIFIKYHLPKIIFLKLKNKG